MDSFKDFISLLTTIAIWKNLAIGGATGYLASQLTGPRKSDIENIEKGMTSASTATAVDTLQKKLLQQRVDSLSKQDNKQPQTMRLA